MGKTGPKSAKAKAQIGKHGKRGEAPARETTDGEDGDMHPESQTVLVGSSREADVEDAYGRARFVGGERRKPIVPRSQRPSRHASPLQDHLVDGSSLVSRK